jgi:hypothetical protein
MLCAGVSNMRMLHCGSHDIASVVSYRKGEDC